MADTGEFSCLWRLDGQSVLSIVTRGLAEMPRLFAGTDGTG
jgi:hypothetical protein